MPPTLDSVPRENGVRKLLIEQTRHGYKTLAWIVDLSCKRVKLIKWVELKQNPDHRRKKKLDLLEIQSQSLKNKHGRR